MHHEASLIATIAMSLLFAFGGGWIASKLRLPPLVGYLLAGIAVGPFTPGFVADSGLAQQLAEIGVILLMFGVGLHFSVRELWAVRWIALPGAVAQIAVATTIGAVLATIWGWSLPAGLVFGLALSVASTVVLLRALEERNAVQTLNGRIAVGWLIVEDLATVIALVLLPALATAMNSPHAAGAAGLADILPALGLTLAKVALFIAIVLIGGRRVVPWILEQVARQGSREMFTLAVLALALGIAYLSSALFGVSFALGAFFAGVVMSESDLSHQATADSMPLKEAFAVLFFVSVGMLFDPSILIREPLAVLAVLAVIIVGKSLAAFAIVLLFRYPISTALIVSASLAQIGEFSFILAALGLSLGLLPPEGQTYILAGALMSIALNPAVFWAMGPLERWLRAHPRLLSLIERSGHDRLSDLPAAQEESGLHDHAVIVGFGRVGRTVAEAFDAAKIPYIVIEQNRQKVVAVRKEGRSVLYGDASVPGVLDKADINQARLLVVAIPDGFQVRQVVDIAQTSAPLIDIVARTHSEHERDYLQRQGVGMAVMGEHQLALAMTDYALDGFKSSSHDPSQPGTSR
ncbi:YbaL family putative K(+) efflux transporter [Magnetospirillum molischianum]|uniref:Putative monovalent cation:proton antiporter (CPA2 family) n=1 Tax=Magnetospirillum molischianum DSM 120 TaxID=1150626 RepID=H8FUE3_MAGML|nr:YbaL family putative K(+) efflux transporter [Magnetospirillum molischianum]CCG41981.1 putative monovalent cation:proton antiporter (CPA2 family) [Magnetospirillum molischianum DSM 120]